MRNRPHAILIVFVFSWMLTAALLLGSQAFARGGGGGSGGGGGGGGHGYHSSYSGGSGSSDTPMTRGQFEFMLIAAIPTSIFTLILLQRASAINKKRREAFFASLRAAAATDPSWDPDAMLARARDVFMRFQQAWGANDTAAMNDILSDSYRTRATLELQVLSAMKRQDVMSEIVIKGAWITTASVGEPNAPKSFNVTFVASATDKLMETDSGKTLFTDTDPFTEYWHFVWENGAWKLDLIKQETESGAYAEKAIADFSQKNGFFYDADFGWLMMPDKGTLFHAASFGMSDINNHVIGTYRNKIVEFYTYIPDRTDMPPANYLVAQAVLPKEYHDVLITKRGLISFCPRGLKEMSLEFPDFNKKFQVCVHPDDQISSLELLTPNFMEKIFDLPFDLHVELVGRFLYLYTKKRDVSYDQMLEVLSWAFDEMKA